MSDTNAQEPTMEEILASIRRIISEDDAPPADQQATPPAATEEPAASTAAEPEPSYASEPADATFEEEDVLELTEQVDAPASHQTQSEPEQPMPNETLGDLDVFTPSTASAVDAQTFSGAHTGAGDGGLVGAPAAQSASSAFGQLSKSLTIPSDGRTLEDVVNDLLRPLLKDWLDKNLSAIVEAKVQAEVERIARHQTY